MSPGAEAPRVVLPTPPALFAERALRFAHLEQGHAMADYLHLMGDLAQAQAAAVGLQAPAALDDAILAQSRDYGMPPLSAQGHARDAQWLADLAALQAALASNVAARAMLDAVAALNPVGIEALADRILAGMTLDSDAAAVPLVGAALQLYFTRLAAALDLDVVKCFDTPTVCPVCATRPVASVVRLGGDRNNLRYLVCALCSTEWNLARIQCSACQSETGVTYLSATRAPEGDAPDPSPAPALSEQATRAESCDTCKTYLKIFYQEKDPQLEPMADDLASLALDLALDEQGYARSGPNLLIHPGGN